MALLYCEVCGSLIAKPPGEQPIRTEQGAICDRCWESRKVIIGASGSSSDSFAGDAPAASSDDAAVLATNASSSVGSSSTGDVMSFGCLRCRSLLQLAPVQRRTRVRCPGCAAEFYLGQDGRPEPLPPAGALAGGAPQAPRQQKLIDDLRPKDDLGFLENIPKRQTSLPSVLDSDQYAGFSTSSSSSGSRPAPVQDPGFELAPEEQDEAARAAPERGARPAKGGWGRRKKGPDAAEISRRRDEQAQKWREAQKASEARERATSRTLFAAVGLVALALAPLIVTAPLLLSTARGTGFAASDDGIGGALRDLGEVVRDGIIQWQ